MSGRLAPSICCTDFSRIFLCMGWSRNKTSNSQVGFCEAGEAKMLRTRNMIGMLAMVLMTVAACMAADKEHGTVVQESPIYVSPDLRAARVGTATRGIDTFLMEHSIIEGKAWAHVLVTI